MSTDAKRGRATLLPLFLLTITLAAVTPAPATAQDTPPVVITVQPGDTWTALALRYNSDAAELRALNPHMNAARQPAIGRAVTLPAGATERTGRLIRPEGGLVSSAVGLGLPVWALALRERAAVPLRAPLPPAAGRARRRPHPRPAGGRDRAGAVGRARAAGDGPRPVGDDEHRRRRPLGRAGRAARLFRHGGRALHRRRGHRRVLQRPRAGAGHARRRWPGLGPALGFCQTGVGVSGIDPDRRGGPDRPAGP